jgi:MarR family transcriptional regulator, lower aerobic nicotinate degradation pathway regulator
MDIQFIKNLLDEADQFSKETPGKTADLAAFGAWLQRRHAADRKTPAAPPGGGETTESVIGKLLVFMNRYAKSYSKKLLEGSALGSSDEFVFLIYLLNRGKTTKTELIEAARLEKPTGMEIMRRLLQLGFIAQEDHETDKRSKNIRLTDAGRAALFECLGRFDQLAHLLTGNLDDAEKNELLRLLQKLEDFHLPLRTEQRGATWEEVLARAGIA